MFLNYVLNAFLQEFEIKNSPTRFFWRKAFVWTLKGQHYGAKFQVFRGLIEYWMDYCNITTICLTFLHIWKEDNNSSMGGIKYEYPLQSNWYYIDISVYDFPQKYIDYRFLFNAFLKFVEKLKPNVNLD